MNISRQEQQLRAADHYHARLDETPAKHRAWFEALIEDLVRRAINAGKN